MKHNKRYYKFLMLICMLVVLIISGCSTTIDNNIEPKPIELNQQLIINNITSINEKLLIESKEDKSNKYNYSEIEIDDNTKFEVIVSVGEETVADSFLQQTKIGTLSEYIFSEAGKTIIDSMIAKQNYVKNCISKAEIEIEYECSFTTLLNGFGAIIYKKDIEKLRNIEGIVAVSISEQYEAPSSTKSAEVFDFMQNTGIFKNESKYKGEGMLIAVIDTGLDYNHSAFLTEPGKVSYTEEQMDSLIKNTGIQGRYFNSKIAYMYDYANEDNDVYASNTHGTHVAGIAAGNNDVIQGVAPNAQLAIMKVFADGNGGGNGLAVIQALSDCAVLGVDVINMSLGTSCGFTDEFGDEKEIIPQTYDIIEKLGITLCAAAGNDFYCTVKSNYQGALTTNPDASTVASPSTYNASFSVAASNRDPIYYLMANNELGIVYTDSVNLKSMPNDFTKILGEEENIKLEYVVIPGVGSKADYNGYDVNGKIAIVMRGDITFQEKQKNAADMGAIACIICNNVDGEIRMQIENLIIPCCAINYKNLQYFKTNTTGYIELGKNTYTGPDMATYSGWGPTSTGLYIKPEITAPGTNIYSSVIGGGYAEMPGTSMASPNMAGLMAIVRQYLREKFPTISEIDLYDMAYQMVMSTADTVNDKYGIPNAVRKQGAGMANLNSVLNTNAYLSVTGSNRTKIELGSDKKQTGIYTLNFNVVNFGNEAVSYNLDTIILTETIFDMYIRNAAKILYGNDIDVSVRNGEYKDGIVTVAGNSTARVSVTITLTTENKNYIKSTFKNGMYVEGFVKLNNTDKNGISLSIPWLAFFGDYDALPVFQSDIYDDEIAQNYETMPLSLYKNQYLMTLGNYPYVVDDGIEAPKPSKEKIVLSQLEGALNNLYTINTGLYRNIDRLDYYLVDAYTDELIWWAYAYNVRKTYYSTSSGRIVPMQHILNIEISKLDVANNQLLEMRLVASYKDNNNKFTYSFPIYIDSEAPTLLNAVYTEKNNKKTVELSLYDNKNLCDIQIYTKDSNGTYIAVIEDIIPLINYKEGENVNYSLDITNVIDKVYNNCIYIIIEDYALNNAVYEIKLNQGTEIHPYSDFEIDESGILVNYRGNAKKIIIPKNVVEIGIGAFKNNTSIEEVDLSNTNIKIIGANAFRGCEKLTKINFNNSLEGIHTYAFAECTQLTKIILPDSLRKIDDGAFKASTKLSAIDLYGSNEIEFGWSIFQNIPSVNLFVEEAVYSTYLKLSQFGSNVEIFNLTNYDIDSNILTSYNGNDKNIAFPASVEIVGENAIVDNNDIINVDFKGIKEIRSHAFNRCNGLQNIVIYEDTKNIKDNAFTDCESLINIEIKTTNPFNIGKNIFNNIHSDFVLYIPDGTTEAFTADANFNAYKNHIKEKVYYEIVDEILVFYMGNPKVIEIPYNVKGIGDYAFLNKTNIEKVVLSQYVSTIGKAAFKGCINLKEINMVDSIKTIEDSAFEGCINLKSFTFSQKMGKLHSYVFRGSGIEELIIPSRIYVIEEKSVSEMPELKKLTIESQLIASYSGYKSIDLENMISDNPKLEELILNGDFVYIGNNNKTNLKGCIALNKIIINANVNLITSNTFSMLDNLETVIVNGNIDSIEGSAFSSNPKLSKVQLNGYVNYIGGGVFNNSPMLKAFSIDENSKIYSMDEYGVLYNKEMSRIYRQPDGWDYNGTYIMPDSVTDMDSYAMSSENPNSTKALLTGVKLSKNLTYISAFAFNNAINLKSINFENINEIYDGAFINTAIEEFSFTSQYQFFGRKVFSKSKMKTINIEADAIQFVYSSLFSECNYITSVNAEEGNKSISIENGIIFNADKSVIERYNYNNTLLDTEYIIPDTIIKIAANAFLNNKELTKITIPASVKAIGDKAFFGTDNLVEYHFLGTEAPLLEGVLRDTMLPYANFFDNIETLDKELIIYHPVNGAHYYNLIWSSFFTVRKEVNPDGSVVTENKANTNMQNGIALVNDRKYF